MLIERCIRSMQHARKSASSVTIVFEECMRSVRPNPTLPRRRPVPIGKSTSSGKLCRTREACGILVRSISSNLAASAAGHQNTDQPVSRNEEGEAYGRHPRPSSMCEGRDELMRKDVVARMSGSGSPKKRCGKRPDPRPCKPQQAYPCSWRESCRLNAEWLELISARILAGHMMQSAMRRSAPQPANENRA